MWRYHDIGPHLPAQEQRVGLIAGGVRKTGRIEVRTFARSARGVSETVSGSHGGPPPSRSGAERDARCDRTWVGDHNSLALPIAADVFEPFGLMLRPEIAAISMSCSRCSWPCTRPRSDGCACRGGRRRRLARSEEHTSELQSRPHLVCRLLLEKKKKTIDNVFFFKKKKKIKK